MTGDDIKALRHKLGLTQEQFAKRFKVSTRAVEDWEQGLKHPRGLTLDALERLAKRTDKERAT